MGVEPHENGGSAHDQQVALYGETWSERLARLTATYHLSQSRLAAVIGLSAPMLSQLITGRRVKMSNPAVYGRVVRLEQLQSDPRVSGGDAESIAEVLDEVAASSPVLTTVTARVPTAGGHQEPIGGEQLDLANRLSSLALPSQLVDTAEAAEAAGATRLAAVLRQAAG